MATLTAAAPTFVDLLKQMAELLSLQADMARRLADEIERTKPAPAPVPVENRGYLRRSEAAEYLGVTSVTLERWHREGRGPACAQVEGMWFYAIADLDAHARGQSEAEVAVRQ